MNLVVLLVLDAAQILALKADLDRLHNYDVLRYDIVVRPKEAGAEVDCTVTLKMTREGPVRFLLSRAVSGLTVERGGKPVRFVLREHLLGKLAGLFPHVHRETVPKILTLPRAAAGAQLELRMRYLWKPSGEALAYASKGTLQTHLASFWVPTMAHEFFDVKISVDTKKTVVATQGRSQVVSLTVGDYVRHERGAYTLLLPADRDADADAILKDAERIGRQLTAWFGPALPQRFTIVVDPGVGAMSFCAGSFVVLRRDAADKRGFWLPLLAHEMAHVWWGHKLANPIVGDGGTWLREGLAEWSKIKVLGAMLGRAAERSAFRQTFRQYFAGIDLRRRKPGPEGAIFANESTLLDSTYADPMRVAYKRGALVHRLLEHRVGERRFMQVLKDVAQNARETLFDARAYAAALGAEALVNYYARRSRLPDFEIVRVKAGEATLRCLDPDWPGGRVPCRVDRAWIVADFSGGRATLRWPAGEGLLPLRVEVDPERIFLDPVRSNSVWEKK